MAGRISKAAFWELVKFKYPMHQIVFCRLISLANVLHCENPKKIEAEWIEEYRLKRGNFDITDVDKELVDEILSETQMGKVYMRLILSTLQPEEGYIDIAVAAIMVSVA